MVVYGVETFSGALAEMSALWPLHWSEVDSDQDAIKLDMNVGKYLQAEQLGLLHVMTARDVGRLVGYCICFIEKHLHYQHVLTAVSDIFFILPSHRVGRVPVKFFAAIEQSLKTLGVKKMYMVSKKSKPVGRLFEYLGMHEDEVVHSKVLGD